jgi:DNA-binding NtrC family response regulator
MSPPPKHPILLVDDEPEMLFSLQGLLRREFELHTAESAAAALEVLQQHVIHVLLTDQRMPGMTGIQLLRQVKAEYPATVRIVFTGYADIKAVIDGVNHVGLYRYLTKPWDPDELIQVLHEAANWYEERAARQQLLADLRDHVQAGELLAQGGPAPVAYADYVQTGRHLLQRLDRALATRSEA